METAFAGPKKIADRIGGVDAREIADYDPEKFAALCSERPAIHRFPGSMAKRIQTLAQIIVDRYDGDAAALWVAGNPDGAEVLARLKELPGFGEQKARIFLALLGKQYGVTPKGWREAAGEYGKAGHAHFGGRHRRRRLAGKGAVVQEADEGGGQGGQKLTRGAWPRGHRRGDNHRGSPRPTSVRPRGMARRMVLERTFPGLLRREWIPRASSQPAGPRRKPNA